MRFYLKFFVLMFTVLEGTSVQAATIYDVDTDHNGLINFSDYVRFAQGYGRTAEDAAQDGLPLYDWDGSGVVDFGDFIIFASFYGQSYEITIEMTTSGLSDTLAVGLTDTLYVSIATNSLPRGCDATIFKIKQVGGNSEVEFEHIERSFDPESQTEAYGIRITEPGEFLLSVEFTACSSSAKKEISIVGITP